MAKDIFIQKYNLDGSAKITVFISHKHDDLDEIKGLIGLLEKSIISRHTLTVGINQCRKKHLVKRQVK